MGGEGWMAGYLRGIWRNFHVFVMLIASTLFPELFCRDVFSDKVATSARCNFFTPILSVISMIHSWFVYRGRYSQRF